MATEEMKPYIEKQEGELLLSKDWNNMQMAAKKEMATRHDTLKEEMSTSTKKLDDGLSSLTQTTQKDKADLTSLINKTVPPGVILMWSGAVDKIPEGWVLCNGAKGTPDLRNRFITGAGGQYSVGANGGSDSVRLVESEIPQHDHYVGTYLSDASNIYMYASSSSAPYLGLHRGSWTWGGRTGFVGGNGYHENRPPYYALCFIMKL